MVWNLDSDQHAIPSHAFIIIYPVRTELSATPTPLSSMRTRTQAKEPATPDQLHPAGPSRANPSDRTALEQLLRDAYAPLRRYITRLVGAALADDILQETSLQIFRKLPFSALSPPSSAPGPSGSLRVLPSRISNALAAGSPLDDAPPEHLTTLNPSLRRATPTRPSCPSLTTSSPASRAVLLLRYQHDLTLEECAAIP